jgi:hypothetical protein
MTIVVPGASILDGPPRVSYVTVVTKYARAVLKEASNLESQERAGRRGPREFHSKHIERAANWVSERGSTQRPRSGWYLAGRIGQALLVIATSVFLAFMVLPEAWPALSYLFTGSLVLTVALTVVVEVQDWRSRR